MRQYRSDPDKWVDVEWDNSEDKLFDVNIKITVANERGVLAKVGAAIAEGKSNIDHIAMDEKDGSAYTAMRFTIQVRDREHLSIVMQKLRALQEVVRIARIKGAR